MNIKIDESTLTIFDVPASYSIENIDDTISFTMNVDYHCRLVFVKQENDPQVCDVYISDKNGELIKCFQPCGLCFFLEYGYFFSTMQFDRVMGRYGCFESLGGMAYISTSECFEVHQALKTFYQQEFIQGHLRTLAVSNTTNQMYSSEELKRNMTFVKDMCYNIFIHPKTISVFEDKLIRKVSDMKLSKIDHLQLAVVSSFSLEHYNGNQFDYTLSQLSNENIETIKKRLSHLPNNSEIEETVLNFIDGNFEYFTSIIWNEFGSEITNATIYWLVYDIILSSACFIYGGAFLSITNHDIAYYSNYTCQEIISEYIENHYDTICSDPETYYCFCLYYLVSQKKIIDEGTGMPCSGILSGYEKYYTFYYNSLLEKENKHQFDQFKQQLNKTQDAVSDHITIDDIDLMSGLEFEQYISDYFHQKGYHTEITKGSGDQGIDVIAEKGSTRIGIQVKCYSGNVGNAAVQEAVAGKAFYKLDKVMVITNSYFTSSAVELAQANNVILWDRSILKEKL